MDKSSQDFVAMCTVTRHHFFLPLQAGPGRHVDDHIVIELQQRIRDLQEKLDSVGVYEVLLYNTFS